ncbi:hypothetical protein P9VFCI_133 [Rhizobium phage P9VFCI]|uniref:Uncharacterized protein n=1 Tax=Rhizobium phage P9VFCI TaxID=2763531 RepID=A0A7G7WXH5_9CAUD|nr:hypothetical protein PP937_gp133 [Rhizobium phage P9VFCI]QNH71919.1 hypothetical protein P9VFCI_133 [Rhizobium phage P9VFCI]
MTNEPKMILYDRGRTNPLFVMEIELEYQKDIDKFLVVVFEVVEVLDRDQYSIYDIIKVDSRNDQGLRDIARYIWMRIDHSDIIKIRGEWEFGRARTPDTKLLKAMKQVLNGEQK